MSTAIDTTIHDAIHQSVHSNEIVHLSDAPTLCDELLILCDDSASTQDQDGQPVEEFWGTTDNGDTWRIHVHG